jgi:acetyl esterase
MPEPSNAKYFETDPDWHEFASKHGYALKTEPHEVGDLSDVAGNRTAQNISEGEWETSHPLRDVGYTSRFERVPVRDGEKVWIKICRSTRVNKDEKLPLLFVTHGGGWIQGTHITEEAWLLWPLMQRFDFVTISVDYRLAPEHKYPTFINDSWDALKDVLARSDELVFDRNKVLLAGSSAGGCIAASLAQQARDAGVAIKGVVLNVPITCDPRHFPAGDYEYTAYKQCFGTLLSGPEMEQIWEMVVPAEQGKSPLVSPLLGNVTGLPPHSVFVAGQDPLRDEGIAYAEKLRSSGIKTSQHVYQGVPHTFGEFWDLTMTQKFWGDLRAAVRSLLRD